MVPYRLVHRTDWDPTIINSLTANRLAAIRMPVHFPTDRECLERSIEAMVKFNFDGQANLISRFRPVEQTAGPH